MSSFELLLATVARKRPTRELSSSMSDFKRGQYAFYEHKQQEEIKHPQVDGWREKSCQPRACRGNEHGRDANNSSGFEVDDVSFKVADSAADCTGHHGQQGGSARYQIAGAEHDAHARNEHRAAAYAEQSGQNTRDDAEQHHACTGEPGDSDVRDARRAFEELANNNAYKEYDEGPA